MGILTVLFASSAEWAAKGETERVRRSLQDTVNVIVFLLVPASAGVIILSDTIIRVVLSRGSFDESSLRMTSGALCCYTVGLPFLAVRDAVIKVYYAFKDTKTTTRTSVMAIGINIILNLVLSRFFGLNGLAAATSISAVFHCLYLYFALRRKIGDFGASVTASVVIKSLSAAVVMVLCISRLDKLFTASVASDLLRSLICAAIGAAVYFAVCFVLRNRAIIVLRSKEEY